MQLPTVENKLSEFDARLSRIEGLFEQMDKRLSNVEQAIRDLQQETKSNMRWIIGIHLTSFVALGTLILVKLG